MDLDADIVALLQGKNRPIRQTVRELIVLELYREGELSGRRAAEILPLSREDFIRFASERGVPYFQLDGDEIGRAVDTIEEAAVIGRILRHLGVPTEITAPRPARAPPLPVGVPAVAGWDDDTSVFNSCS